LKRKLSLKKEREEKTKKGRRRVRKKGQQKSLEEKGKGEKSCPAHASNLQPHAHRGRGQTGRPTHLCEHFFLSRIYLFIEATHKRVWSRRGECRPMTMNTDHPGEGVKKKQVWRRDEERREEKRNEENRREETQRGEKRLKEERRDSERREEKRREERRGEERRGEERREEKRLKEKRSLQLFNGFRPFSKIYFHSLFQNDWRPFRFLPFIFLN
jgi:hypothetical protein